MSKSREEILNKHSIVSVYLKLGGKNTVSNAGNVKCILPGHEDNTPSMHLYPDTHSWNCFTGCGGGSTFDLIMKVLGVDFKGALEWLGETETPILQKEKYTAKSYLPDHGLTSETCDKFGFKVTADKFGKPAVAFPVDGRDHIRLFNQKLKFIWTGESKPAGLWKSGGVEDDSPVVLCEGEAKAALIWQETGLTAWSGTAGKDTFKNDWIKDFEKVKEIIIVPDHDEPGRSTMTEKIVKALGPQRCKILNYSYEYKDITDWFVEGKHSGDDFNNLVNEAIPFTKFNNKQMFETIDASSLLDKEFPEEKWLIDRFLAEESTILIVGEAGTFKSYLSLYLVKCLFTGIKFLDEFEVIRPCKILVIDKENRLRRIQSRIKSLDFPPTTDVHFMVKPESFMFNDKNPFLKQVGEFVETNKIDVVVFDSFIDMFDGNENSANDTALALNAMRGISSTCTFILLHHDSKPVPKTTRTAAQKTRGSSNIIAQVDSQFYLTKEDNSPGKFFIEQGKSRDTMPLQKFEVEVIIENGILKDFIYRGVVQNEVQKIQLAQEYLYEYIKNNPGVGRQQLLELSEELGCGERTITSAIKALEKNNLIDSTTRPGYGNKKFYMTLEYKTE